MKVIDRAKSHFESLGVQDIEIEEWKDDEGKPTVIYWNPITLAEKKKLFSSSLSTIHHKQDGQKVLSMDLMKTSNH